MDINILRRARVLELCSARAARCAGDRQLNPNHAVARTAGSASASWARQSETFEAWLARQPQPTPELQQGAPYSDQPFTAPVTDTSSTVSGINVHDTSGSNDRQAWPPSRMTGGCRQAAPRALVTNCGCELPNVFCLNCARVGGVRMGSQGN